MWMVIKIKTYYKQFNTKEMLNFCDKIRKSLIKINIKDISDFNDITHFKFFSSNNKKIKINEIYLERGIEITVVNIFDKEKEKYIVEYYKGTIRIRKPFKLF